MSLYDPFAFMFRQKRMNESRKDKSSCFNNPAYQKICEEREEQRGSIDFSDMNSIISNIGSFSTSIVPFIQQYGPIVKNLPAMWEFINETSFGQEQTLDGYEQSVEYDSGKYKSVAFYNGNEVEPVPPPPTTAAPVFGSSKPKEDKNIKYVKNANKREKSTKNSGPKLYFNE